MIVKRQSRGVAVGSTILDAYDRAFQADPTSAFGGIIAFNRPLDAVTAKTIVDRQFVEVIIAPDVTPEALAATASKQNVRVLACGQWDNARAPGLGLQTGHRRFAGAGPRFGPGGIVRLKVVTQRQPSDQELADLLFTGVVKFVKSNAIVYGRDGMILGSAPGR